MGNTTSEVQTSSTSKNGKIELPIVNVEDFVNNQDWQKSYSLTNVLAERGFLIVKLNDEIPESSVFKNFTEKATNLYRAGDAFFEQPLETKNLSSDPKNENKGYVNIENLREYLKLRNSDYPDYGTGEKAITWPAHPTNLYDSFSGVYTALLNLGWIAFAKLFDEANPQKTDKDLDLLKDLKACVEEKSSISIIHYFPTNSFSADEKVCEPSNRLLRVDRIPAVYPDSESLYSSKVVCSTHQDTGILTLIVASEVPGLQLFDKRTNTWIDVERLVDAKKYVIIMTGQKISLFASNTIEPTIHRVWLKFNTHRTSMAFLFDIAK